MVSLSSPQYYAGTTETSVATFDDSEFEEEIGYNHNNSRIFTYGLAYFYQLGNPGFKGEYSENPISVVSPSFIKVDHDLTDHQSSSNYNNNNYINMHWKIRLINFYNKYNKSKLKEVDALLVKYKANENELFQALEDKYGAEFDFIKTLGSDNSVDKNGRNKNINKLIFREKFIDIGCSSHGSFALTLSGDLYQWGYLYDDIYIKPSLIWDHVHYRARASVINCGKKHAALITENGEVYTWGCGLDGQLGHGTRNGRHKPTYVEALKLQNIQCVGCGGGHTAVANDAGKLFTFGNNRNGQLGFAPGRDSKLTVKKPKLVKTAPMAQTYCTSIACGRQHTAIISDQGFIFTFGGGKFGRLGHGPSALREQNFDQGVAKSVVYKPRILKHGSLNRPLIGYQVACGDFHTVILDTEGTTYTCGKNDDGQCGHGTPHNYVSPRIVETLSGIEVLMVAAGGNVSMALVADGSVYTWGNSESGSLGFTVDHAHYNKTSNIGVDPILDGKNAVTLPCQLKNTPSFATNIACSGVHTLILADDNFDEDYIHTKSTNLISENYRNIQEQHLFTRNEYTNTNDMYTYNDYNSSSNLIKKQNVEHRNLSENSSFSNSIINNMDKQNGTCNQVADNLETMSDIFDAKYLFSRARHGHYASVLEALQKGFPVDTRDAKGNTLLLVASQNGQKRITKLCLRHGADINAQNSISGNTALHFSFLYNHLSLFDYLLGKGADDNILNKVKETCYDLKSNN